jgi:hypothetical protein
MAPALLDTVEVMVPRVRNHYADAVFSEPGRCWRMVHDGEGSGRPTFWEEPVVWVGNHQLVGGKQIRVWSCEDTERASRSQSRSAIGRGNDRVLTLGRDLCLRCLLTEPRDRLLDPRLGGVAQKPTTGANQELRDDDLDVTGAPLLYRGAVADDGTGLVFQQLGEHAHATGQSGPFNNEGPDMIKRQ